MSSRSKMIVKDMAYPPEPSSSGVSHGLAPPRNLAAFSRDDRAPDVTASSWPSGWQRMADAETLE